MASVRNGVEIARSGVLGEIYEVHCWVGGDRGMPKIPTDAPPVPSNVNWDLWLGPAKERPYHSTYCPYGWRFWWDFGTGETGNWGCHILDIPFWALDLRSPTRVEASGPAVHEATTPKEMHVVYDFPANDKRGPVSLKWHHTKSDPPVLAEHSVKGDGFNTFFLGKKASLLCGFGKWKLVPGESFADYKPPKTFKDSPGFHKEWLNAIRGDEPASCNFDYTGPLTETVLLGNVAYRAGEKFEWDAEKLETVGSAKAQGLIREEYRKGWET
jgi:predicted dehydrogenase